MNKRFLVFGTVVGVGLFAVVAFVSSQIAQAEFVIGAEEDTTIGETQADPENCGDGVKPCDCNDNVITNYTMTSDIINCNDWGLQILNGATLDCNGHVVDGISDEFMNYFGIAAMDNSTVRNCEVKEFIQGIQATYNAQVLNNYSHHNLSMGLSIAVTNVTDIRVSGNTFSNNPYGLYLRKGLNNRIWDNVFTNNSIANAFEEDAIRVNAWDSGGVGNVWDDFVSNPGFPTTYHISGPGPGIDHFPSSPPAPPSTPSNPTPADSATWVNVDQNLSWTGGDPNGDPTTYDIYLDTNPTPTTQVAAGWGSTSYEPGTLAYSTTYYWKIIAHANGDTTNGPIWSFSTEPPNSAPNVPASPTPANGAIDVDPNTLLGWAGGDPDLGDTVAYDIYLGTSPTPPLVQTNHPTSSYDPAATLSGNTLYYWKIVARDQDGATTAGPVWSFTTEALAYMPGDINGDGVVTSADIIYLVNYVFKSGPAPVPLQSGDVNCDGIITSADIIYLVNYVFKSGPAPLYCS